MSYRFLIGLSFLLNGISMLCSKTVSELNVIEWTPFILTLMYGIASAGTFVRMIAQKPRIKIGNLGVGVISGISSAIGITCATYAAALLDGYIAFPLISGGTIILVAIAGRLIFHEKIGPYGVAGIAVGAAAIVLLSC